MWEVVGCSISPCHIQCKRIKFTKSWNTACHNWEGLWTWMNADLWTIASWLVPLSSSKSVDTMLLLRICRIQGTKTHRVIYENPILPLKRVFGQRFPAVLEMRGGCRLAPKCLKSPLRQTEATHQSPEILPLSHSARKCQGLVFQSRIF